MSNTPNDYLDMIDALNGHGVEFVLVGAYAVAFHGFPRDSLGFDILLRPPPENISRANDALKAFGSPFVITEEDIRYEHLIANKRAAGTRHADVKGARALASTPSASA